MLSSIHPEVSGCSLVDASDPMPVQQVRQISSWSRRAKDRQRRRGGHVPAVVHQAVRAPSHCFAGRNALGLIERVLGFIEQTSACDVAGVLLRGVTPSLASQIQMKVVL